jgi:hypothetical protein
VRAADPAGAPVLVGPACHAFAHLRMQRGRRHTHPEQGGSRGAARVAIESLFEERGAAEFVKDFTNVVEGSGCPRTASAVAGAWAIPHSSGAAGEWSHAVAELGL